MNRFVEFGIVLVLAILVGGGIAVFGGWEYIHDKLRRERKEDAQETRSAR